MEKDEIETAMTKFGFDEIGMFDNMFVNPQYVSWRSNMTLSYQCVIQNFEVSRLLPATKLVVAQ